MIMQNAVFARKRIKPCVWKFRKLDDKAFVPFLHSFVKVLNAYDFFSDLGDCSVHSRICSIKHI